jgi:hypothetical protein
MNGEQREGVNFFKGLFWGCLFGMLSWVLVIAAILLLSGCAPIRAFYGDNWYEGWNCYSRYGTDVCGALDIPARK